MGINSYSRLKQSRTSAGKGFTLVELLVVISIMVTLMALAIPAFNSIGRGTAARTAATQLVSAMTFARQQAVVSGINTYIVFPDGDQGLYANDEERKYALRSYAILSVRNAPDGTNYVRNWMFLPKGVVFVPSSGSYGGSPLIDDDKSIFSTVAGDDFLDKIRKDIPFPESSSRLEEMRVIGFSPDGSAFAVDGNLRGPDAEIWISDGVTEPELGGDIVPLFRNTTDSSLYSVDLNPLTGQARIRDYRAL